VHWRHDDPDERDVEDIAFSDLVLREIHALEHRLARKLAAADE
jgi:hypothetical protein